jgi:hypothetical protein
MMSDLIERLDHAIATARNDDMSKPRTELRQRHVMRVQGMQEAAVELARLTAENEALRAAVAEAEKTLSGIADANWRTWGSETGPEDFVDWARSRARHTAGCLARIAIAQQEEPK